MAAVGKMAETPRLQAVSFAVLVATYLRCGGGGPMRPMRP